MNYNIFDLESAPLSETEIARFMPEFQAPSNYKDPAKIAGHIAMQAREWIDQAALSALTGRVLCIGIASSETSQYVLDDEREEVTIGAFWNLFRQSAVVWVGWNCKHFDLPFLVRRSWHLGVQVPPDLYQGRYFSTKIIDLMELWGCGNHGDRLSLDTAAKFMGVGAKNGDGADFSNLWATDRQKAYEYLKNDLVLTYALAQKMGVIREHQEEPEYCEVDGMS